ncbi:MAG: hypothetical protein WAL38_18900 [Solirubrobacteraceae bacterium]
MGASLAVVLASVTAATQHDEIALVEREQRRESELIDVVHDELTSRATAGASSTGAQL